MHTEKTPQKHSKKIGSGIGNHGINDVNAGKRKHPRFSDRFLFALAYICLTLLLLGASTILVLLLLSCGTSKSVSPPEAHAGIVSSIFLITNCWVQCKAAGHNGGCKPDPSIKIKSYNPQDWKPYKLTEQFYSLN